MASYKNQKIELDNAIARLELEREETLIALKNQIKTTTESLKPINLLKDTFNSFQDSPELKSSLFITVASLVGGYLSKKIVIKKSNSIFKNILGYVLQYGVSNFISKKVNSNS